MEKTIICWLCGKESLKKMKSDIQYWWLCDCGTTTVPKLFSKVHISIQSCCWVNPLVKVFGAYERTKGKQVRG